MPSRSKVYSPTSPALQSTLDRHHLSSGLLPPTFDNQQALYHHHSLHTDQSSKSFTSMQESSHHQANSQCASQCMRFRYFTIFLICTTCLTLLSASLATHKWIISKPIRMLKLNNSQTNWTSLMLIASQNEYPTTTSHMINRNNYSNNKATSASLSLPNNDQNNRRNLNPNSLLPYDEGNNSNQDGGPNVFLGASYDNSNNGIEKSQSSNGGQNKKFQGEIYFGLFRGLKILNHGFGDRQTLISVSAPFTRDNSVGNQAELVDFRLWLLTLTSVSLAILFALIGSIFAIINFVMSPRGTLTGPIGLVIWNATACFACLVAALAWLAEYVLHLKANVLTPEEVQNGWTSERRSQFGYSYYLVLSALILHLVNIFIVSIVQFESWTKNSRNSKRMARPVCEGVTMLY